MNQFPVFDPVISWQITLTLFHVAWLGFVIAGIAVAGNWWWRDASANRRHTLNFGALLALGIALPATFLAVRLATVPPAATPSATAAPAAPGAPAAEDLIPGFAGPAVPVSNPPTPWIDVRIRSQTIAMLYVLGVAAMLVKLGLSIYGGHRLRAASRPITDGRQLDIVAAQCRRLGLRVVPALGCCERLAAPVVLGILRPMILIPASLLTGLNPEQLTAVLTHELAHIRRFDHLFLLIQRLIEAFLFFHPAVWYLSRCIAHERENCCDDLVLAAGTDRMGYSLSLLRVAELNCERARTGVALTGLAADGDQPSQLRRRIARLLGVAAGPPGPFIQSGLVAGTLLLVLAAGVTFWILRPNKADRDRQAAVSEQPKTAAVTDTSHPGAGTDEEEIAGAAPSDTLKRPTVRLVPGRPETVVVTGGGGPRKLQMADVAEAPARFLRLRGSLVLDPNRLARIRARIDGAINGEIVEIASVESDASQPAGDASRRTIRMGDHVRKRDVLAIVQAYERDAVAEDANRAGETGPSRIEIRAPIGGVIVEKNIVAGAIVDRDDILFQIADLSQLMVLAEVAEDDLPAIRSLPPEMRRWTIHWKREQHRPPIDATFDLIGQIIDPGNHSAIITGWIDNSDLSLLAGQSITAVIDIPADPSTAEIPEHALIEERSSFVVLVKDGKGEEFTRRKVAVRRWAGGSAFIGLQVTDEERSRGVAALHVGEQVLYLFAREVDAEWKNLRSRAVPP